MQPTENIMEPQRQEVLVSSKCHCVCPQNKIELQRQSSSVKDTANLPVEKAYEQANTRARLATV